MLVLAIDTSTPAVTAGVVAASADATATASADAAHTLAVHTLAARVTVDARAHAEVLTPQILDAIAETGKSTADLDAVVVGVGPGPFTGLRVGMATAAAFADALSIPVYGVCGLDAIARQVGTDEELLVVTDARRREVYWARYRGRSRVEGPAVSKPADVPAAPSTVVAGSAVHAGLFDLPRRDVQAPSPAGLVSVAAEQLLAHAEPAPLVPLYLRRPDAVETADRRG
ncbi:tRNA (adenosine(37)-N6)-threonylcarbamoyltransferase complex dimerization subunit type 1 TsaB [Rhodococcus triatomae]|uniref:tRNA threonylcarbamoyl adenosine modification protein YeaZ n=1 Tax=Rhodococcus triatomae TaxID=300028 RepID=A0A1G8R6C3_9NOCA|nr:tRNA (adenosine(37)-N6)-threonylcarbamoyltransferase complex dimerization subunit type 1 TsaB [Rhodococcus triatomae]QNG19576.1 tRNA (adenosine(37)-N6)-threonylcarbamoyltransferase complex dimerization subunit type 1 TsaB [Rhodococcus triatomae]QNG24509.1 tRNA (adenosine(37)-N6)-threonylcarbamoyltransferase complex dimerization subunit type 1 TsaB [Rhodococcus triatomae]SDJ12125.1 tRNA threonylcarbamoyl adenosine modification protein YeaZ [Rhodococcus triatomae]